MDAAVAMSGVEQVYAVLGGFHLAPAEADDIERTIDEFIKRQVTMVCPTHCSGSQAIRQFAIRMPEAYVEGAVGTRFIF